MQMFSHPFLFLFLFFLFFLSRLLSLNTSLLPQIFPFFDLSQQLMTALEKPLPIGESISRRVLRQRIVPGGNGKRYSRKRVKWGAQAPLLLASQRLVTGNLLNLANISSTATASADTTHELL